MRIQPIHAHSLVDRFFERVIPERFLQSEHVFLAKVLWVYSMALGGMGLFVLLLLALNEGDIQPRRVVTVVFASLFLFVPLIMRFSREIIWVSLYVFTLSTCGVFYIDYNNQSIAGPSTVLWVGPAMFSALIFTGKHMLVACIVLSILCGFNIYQLSNGALPPAIVNPENWQKVEIAYLVMINVLVMICLWGTTGLASRHLHSLNTELTNKQNTIDEINHLKHAAEASAHSKSMFLATMSHELRTPLNSVIGNSQLLSRADLPQKYHMQVNDIATSGNLLLMLINDILDYSKLEENELKLIEEPYDLSKQISELSRIMQPKLKQDVTLNYVLPQVPVYIRADQNRLAQVLMNLISNAIKFTDSGEVNIAVSVASNHDVRITVSDTGIGIDQQYIQTLFTEFTQVTNDSGRNMEGTGLGLAISMGIIKQMNGDIEVESELNKGSAFTVVLPNREITQETSVLDDIPLEEAESFDLQNVSLLIVDDIAVNCTVLESMLMDFNTQKIVAVNSGEQAIQYITNHLTTEIILMDMRMPEMDGVEATRRIRKLGYKGKIIAVTANASDEDRAACLEAGMNEFISKPIVMDNLMRAINKVLS